VVVSRHQYLYRFFEEGKILSEKEIVEISGYFKNYKTEFEILLELAECDNEGRVSSKKRHGLRDFFFPVLNRIKNENTYSLDKLDFKIGIGLPASGKSTFSKTLKNYTILSRDSCAEELFGDYSQITKEQIYDSQVDNLFFKKLNVALKKDANIFIDKTNLTKDSQRRILSGVSSAKFNKSCVVFMKDLELVKKDLEARKNLTGKNIPFNDFKRFLKLFSAPMYDKFDLIEYKILKEGDY
jgi:predicted kinase